MLLELKGTDLLGTPLASPRAAHARVYVLPLLTILTNKVRAGAQARRRRPASQRQGCTSALGGRGVAWVSCVCVSRAAPSNREG